LIGPDTLKHDDFGIRQELEQPDKRWRGLESLGVSWGASMNHGSAFQSVKSAGSSLARSMGQNWVSAVWSSLSTDSIPKRDLSRAHAGVAQDRQHPRLDSAMQPGRLTAATSRRLDACCPAAQIAAFPTIVQLGSIHELCMSAGEGLARG
jgi:hypothetical protein